MFVQGQKKQEVVDISWTFKADVTSATLTTISIPNTAKEILAILYIDDVIRVTEIIPYALYSSTSASFKEPSNIQYELYKSNTKWKVTDATHCKGKIYYR